MILSTIFPPNCIICSRIGHHLCNQCRAFLHNSLPMCFCCKKINNHSLTHSKCRLVLDVDFVFTQWIHNCNSNIINNLVLKDSAYSVFKELLKLINNKELLNLFNTARIEYIKDKNKEVNQNLQKEIIRGFNKNSTDSTLLLVGYHLESLNSVQKQIEDVRRKKPNTRVGIFLLFTTL